MAAWCRKESSTCSRATHLLNHEESQNFASQNQLLGQFYRIVRWIDWQWRMQGFRVNIAFSTWQDQISQAEDLQQNTYQAAMMIILTVDETMPVVAKAAGTGSMAPPMMPVNVWNHQQISLQVYCRALSRYQSKLGYFLPVILWSLGCFAWARENSACGGRSASHTICPSYRHTLHCYSNLKAGSRFPRYKFAVWTENILHSSQLLCSHSNFN